MSTTIGEAAVRSLALAANILGWRPDEFSKATPADLIGALAPLQDAPAAHANREDLYRMMEQDHDR